MNKRIPFFLAALATLATGAPAQQPATCDSLLTFSDVSAAMGGSVRFQPVFGRDGVKGYRLYGTSRSPQLSAMKIGEGTMMTHLCGVAAKQIDANGSQICCRGDTTREFEVVLVIEAQEKRVVIKRS